MQGQRLFADMNRQVEVIDKLQCGCVLLIDQDPERTSYLKNIFEFIDYSIDIIDNQRFTSIYETTEIYTLCLRDRPTMVNLSRLFG